MADPDVRSPAEFREVMDRVFTMMSDDPDMGPKLRDADVPQRFEFPDLDLVVNVRAAGSGEASNLHWEWTDDVDWAPKGRMTMDAPIAAVRPQTLRRGHRCGLIPRGSNGRWTPEAAAQARLVARLRERGHSLEAIREATDSGRLASRYIEDLCPQPDDHVTIRAA